MPKDLSNINFNAGYNNCNDKVAILRNEVVQRKLNNFDEINHDDVDINSYIYVDQNGTPAKIKLGDVIATGATQADWDETDEDSYAFIKNKPELKISDDMVSLYNIGGVKIGQIFPKGTSIIDIVKEILSTDSPEEFYIGAIDNLYPDIVNDMEEISMSTAELISKGYQVQLTLNNQYFALAIPKNSNIEVQAIYQEGFPLGFKVLNLDAAWDLIVDDSLVKSTGMYTFDYRFKLK